MKALQASVTAAQLAAIRNAATRPGRTLKPLPSTIRGAARQYVVEALVSEGYAVKCYLPSHVEYVLTKDGVDLAENLG